MFKNPDLTLTFDPATLTLTKIKVFIIVNLMCKNNQDFFTLLAIIDPQKSPFNAYQTLLGGTQAVFSTPETVLDLRRPLFLEWNQFP